MIIKIIMLLMGWTLATGQGATEYHYIKIRAPGTEDKASNYKTVGSSTYATSNPTMWTDNAGEVWIAWVHKSSSGSVQQPRLYHTTYVTLTASTQVTLTKLTVLDETPRFSLDGSELCFGTKSAEENCFTRDGTDLGSRARAPVLHKLYLPFVAR